jgi:hypothetical protein
MVAAAIWFLWIWRRQMKMQKAAAENNEDGVPELAGREKELRHELHGNALPHELLTDHGYELPHRQHMPPELQ